MLEGEHSEFSNTIILRLSRSGSPLQLEMERDGFPLVTVLCTAGCVCVCVPLSQGLGASLLMESEDSGLPLTQLPHNTKARWEQLRRCYNFTCSALFPDPLPPTPTAAVNSARPFPLQWIRPFPLKLRVKINGSPLNVLVGDFVTTVRKATHKWHPQAGSSWSQHPPWVFGRR